MISIARAAEVVADAIGVAPSDAAQIYRKLGETGLLPRARGPLQPICKPKYAATILIAMATDLGRHVDAAANAVTYGTLRSAAAVMPEHLRPEITDARGAIAAMIADAADPAPDAGQYFRGVSIEFVLSPWREVRLSSPSGPPVSFGGDDRWKATTHKLSNTIPGVALREIAAALEQN
jgi:hypothetical protein